MHPPVNRYNKPAAPVVIPERVAKRAAERYTISETGCWITTYSIGSHGYGQIGWNGDNGRGHNTTVHRAAWTHHQGRQIPEGYTIDHICRTKGCVHPDHLRLLTNFENARRQHGDWPLGHCRHGHPNSELIWYGGRYRCGACRREYKRVRARRAREKRARDTRTNELPKA